MKPKSTAKVYHCRQALVTVFVKRSQAKKNSHHTKTNSHHSKKNSHHAKKNSHKSKKKSHQSKTTSHKTRKNSTDSKKIHTIPRQIHTIPRQGTSRDAPSHTVKARNVKCHYLVKSRHAMSRNSILHLKKLTYFTPRHTTRHHDNTTRVTSHHNTTRHVTPNHANLGTSCDIKPYHIIPHQVKAGRVIHITISMKIKSRNTKPN